jgi:hypothetical protein
LNIDIVKVYNNHARVESFEHRMRVSKGKASIGTKGFKVKVEELMAQPSQS